jgi:hypothetical protein
MPYGLNVGLGRTLAQDAECRANMFGGFFWPSCWSMLQSSPVAPVGSPTGDALTVPPASGEDAQATVDALVNQQMVDQQALNASQVTSSWWDSVTGSVGSAAGSGTNWLLYGVLAVVGIGALVFMGGGSPRRYGR